MTVGGTIAAAALGCVLASLPFLHFAHFGEHGAAHADHEPRHGGQLGMVGDYHVEVVRRRGQVQVFVSDAWRRPIESARAWAVFDDGPPQPLGWSNHRHVGRYVAGAQRIGVEILVSDGTHLATSFDFD